MQARALVVVVVVLAALAGCADLATPSELARPQILAVRADPPAIRAGERSLLTALVAGPDGVIADAAVTWSVAAPTPDLPALGAIELDGDDAYYAAPATVGAPTIAAIQAAVEVDGSPILVALKGVGVGVREPTANPVIASVLVDGAEVAEGGDVELGAGATAALDLVTDPPPTQDAIVHWYATIGEIELYRRAPTELAAGDEPGDGWLVVTFRDEQGGVDWRTARLTVR
jgi:hypothetical protein